MTKTYRTAQGRLVDIGTMMAQQENTRAVGNMNVNARGDTLNSNNNVVSSRSQQVNKHYRKQVTQSNVSDDPVYSSITEATQAAQLAQNVAEVVEPTDVELAELYSDEVVANVVEPEQSGGLAAAIAKARQVKQEALKTPRQIAQERAGVNRI
jgi:hypothetical protein